MTEAEEFRISSDIKQANLEILLGRLEQAEHCIREVAASLAWNCFGECRAVHDGPIMPAQGALEMARDFLASHQVEQCPQCDGSGNVSDSDGCGVWYIDCPSCSKKHPEQADGAQGPWKVSWDYSGSHVQVFADIEPHRPALTVDLNGAGSKEAYAHELAEMLNRAALAQPSPAPELNAIAQEMKPLPTEFAQVIEDHLQELLINGEPAPEPELERPEVVGTVVAGHGGTFDAQLKYGPVNGGRVDIGDELVLAREHDRIVGALRADWNEVRQGLIAQRDAAQARVAELEGLAHSLVPWMERANEKAHEDIPELLHLRAVLSGTAAPVAQAGQVPEGWKPNAELLRQVEALGCDIANCAGTNNRTGARDKIDQLLKLLAAAPAQGGE